MRIKRYQRKYEIDEVHIMMSSVILPQRLPRSILTTVELGTLNYNVRFIIICNFSSEKIEYSKILILNIYVIKYELIGFKLFSSVHTGQRVCTILFNLFLYRTIDCSNKYAYLSL